MPLPLEGRRIALAEGRQLEELAAMLEREGATAIRCPMVSIIDSPDSVAVMAWLRELVAGRFDWIILMTGEALRRLLGFAERDGIRDSVIAALARSRTLTRGPKPVRALKEIGQAPTKIADAPTTEGVIAALREESLHGTTVGVTLYGELNETLVSFLTDRGATVLTVMPYLYAPATEADRVIALIEQMAVGKVDVLLFTSSPQVDRLYEVAKERGRLPQLQQGMTRTRIAAVGPVVAQNLTEKGAHADICPEQGFVMKNLVQQIKRVLGT